MTTRTLRNATGTLLLSLPLAAQIAGGGATVAGGDTTILGRGHIGGLEGPMTRSVWGDFTGDLRADAVVLVGQQPVFLFNAGLHHALTDLPATGTEIARLARSSPAGIDALLVSSGRGLELWSLSFASQSFAVETLGGAAWNHTRRLRSADLFADGRQGIVGLRSDGAALLVLPSPRDPTSELVLPTPYAVHDFVLLQWDGAPGLELALLTSEGLKITDLALAPLLESPVGDHSDRLTVIRQPGKSSERLALCAELAQGYWLFCLDVNRTDQGVFLGVVDLVDAVSADIDADGQHDLLLSQRTTGQLVLFLNQLEEKGQSFSADADGVELYDLTEDKSGALPAPWNHAVPVFVDLDDDGDADVLHPVGKDKNIVLMRSLAIDHRDLVPAPTGGCFQYDEQSGDTLVTLEFAAPRVTPPVTPDVLEIVVWRQAHAGVETDPVPLSMEYVPVTGWPLSASVSLNELLPSEALHHVQVRLGKVAGHQSGRWAGPSYVYSMTASNASVDAMVAYFDIDPDEVLALGTTEMGLACEAPPQPRTSQPGSAPAKPSARGTTQSSGGYIPFSDEGASSVPLSDVPCFTDGWIPWGI